MFSFVFIIKWTLFFLEKYLNFVINYYSILIITKKYNINTLKSW